MRLGRSLRRWLFGTLVPVLLFAQLATAAYACPAVDVDRAQATEMPCVGSMEDGTLQAMDPEQAALCVEHCKSGSKAVDAGNAPVLASPALLAPLIIAGVGGTAAADAPSWVSHARQRERTRPLAHSVLHCCRRD
jgi:hypothetical protein